MAGESGAETAQAVGETCGIFAVREATRNDALVNGALITLGVFGILDNVVAHWLLGLHRVVSGPNAGLVETILTALSAGLLALGLWREARVRQR